jgi:hypothetical protein
MKLGNCMRAWISTPIFDVMTIKNLDNKTLAWIKAVVFLLAASSGLSLRRRLRSALLVAGEKGSQHSRHFCGMVGNLVCNPFVLLVEESS